MYAAIRIRGTVNVIPKMKKALDMLGLKRINNMTLWKEDNQALMMITESKDYVAFGKISDEVLKELIEKRARPIVPGAKVDTKKVLAELAKGKTPKQAGIKNLFTLSPPRGGFERKGVKVPFSTGGALGNRREKINDLIKKMM